MRAGRLNCAIVIQRLVTGQDELGQPNAAWVDVASEWANIAHKSGLETIRAGELVSVVQTSIRIRYRTDLDAGMRVVYGALVYDIRAVMPDLSGRQFTDLVCTVGANNG